MSEKSLSEMTDDEIVLEIQALRERRAQARERRIVEKTTEGVPKKKVEGKVSDALWDMLDNPIETEET